MVLFIRPKSFLIFLSDLRQKYALKTGFPKTAKHAHILSNKCSWEKRQETWWFSVLPCCFKMILLYHLLFHLFECGNSIHLYLFSPPQSTILREQAEWMDKPYNMFWVLISTRGDMMSNFWTSTVYTVTLEGVSSEENIYLILKGKYVLDYALWLLKQSVLTVTGDCEYEGLPLQLPPTYFPWNLSSSSSVNWVCSPSGTA